MSSYEAEVFLVYQQGLRNVRTRPIPKGQKFPPGARVRIADDLSADNMTHFPSGRDATVLYTYAHAYKGVDVTSYALDLDGHGFVAWYYEHQLTLIET